MTWTLYKEIKYATDGIPGSDLTDFPKLFAIAADADIAAEGGGGGGIKFTSADGNTDLAFGLYPSTDITSGDILARVKVSPDADASVGDVICRLYYSSTESTTEDKAGTVDSFALVTPLEEDPSGSEPQIFDWVTETNLGTSAGTMTSGDLVAATVGSGLELDGSDDVVDFGTIAGINSATEATIQAIISRTSTTHSVAGGFSAGASAPPGSRFSFIWFTDANIYVSCGNAVYGSCSLAGTGAHAIAIVFDGAGGSDADRLKLFVDGVQQTLTFSGTIPTSLPSVNPYTVGKDSSDRYGGGTHDEHFVTAGLRTANWLAYAYTDDFANADTFTLSTEQGGGGGVTISPAAASCSAATLGPSVVLGAISLTPTPAAAVAASVDPTVELGAISLTPDPATAVCATIDPTVELGPLSITPDPAAAVCATVDPTVAIGGLTIAPDPASAVAASSDPTVILGPLTLTPDPATAACATAGPTVVGGVSVFPTDVWRVRASRRR